MSPTHDDVACAHGDVPVPVADRRLVAVFASPVATQLVHLARHVRFRCIVLDPVHDLADVVATDARWVGVMGSLRHRAPHVAALEARGLPADRNGRSGAVHRR
jgi:xanthine dehydrogenase accessory factor